MRVSDIAYACGFNEVSLSPTSVPGGSAFLADADAGS